MAAPFLFGDKRIPHPLTVLHLTLEPTDLFIERREDEIWSRAVGPMRKLSFLIPLAMLPLALWLGIRALRVYSLPEIASSISSIPSVSFGVASLCVMASYLSLTGFDALAVRYAGRPLPYHTVALTSFVSLSIGHNVGLAALSSGALRYRFYSSQGLGPVEIGKIIVFCAVTVGLGLISLGGIALVARPTADLGQIGLSPATTRGVGALLLALTGGYLMLAWSLRRPVRMCGHAFRLPSVRMAAAQVAVGTVNFAFVAAALHQLLAGAAVYADVAIAYVLGNVAGLLSHVPGGLGVLEVVTAALLMHGDVLGALIAFRVLYFVVPLILGSALLAAAEVRLWRADRVASPPPDSRPRREKPR